MFFSEKQKLLAIEAKYYNHIKWEPKMWDLYVLTRHSMGLEVFQIVEETEKQWGIKLVLSDNEGFVPWENSSWFDKDGFTNKDFGVNRVWIPPWVLQDSKP